MTSLQLRVELNDITPRIWRELRVPSDLTLPELHLVLQEAFGWQDAHLHAFRRVDDDGVQVWQEAPELFESPLPGVPSPQDETQATAGDLLPEVGAQAVYEYDFGDSWEHTLTVLGEEETDDGARVLAGERLGPPEDCGGVPGYLGLLEILTALARDPEAELDDWDREMVELTFGPRAASEVLAELEEFDVEAANARVAVVTAPVPPLSPELAAAVERAEGLGSRHLTRMVQLGRLDEASEPDADTCAAMMGHVTWFLQHVGPSGLPLTGAGYLRPSDVQAVAERLDVHQEWIGTFNRESQTPQVTELREALQGLGLVRKAKGQLSVTAAGKRLIDDPVGLWRHIAQRLPLGRQEFAKVAGLIVMLDLAAQPVVDPTLWRDLEALSPRQRLEQIPDIQADADQRLSDAVMALGWRTDVGPVEGGHVRAAADATLVILRRCGVLPAHGWQVRWVPTAGGRQFLIAALRG